jgi:hypothetical protein
VDGEAGANVGAGAGVDGEPGASVGAGTSLESDGPSAEKTVTFIC